MGLATEAATAAERIEPPVDWVKPHQVEWRRLPALLIALAQRNVDSLFV